MGFTNGDLSILSVKRVEVLHRVQRQDVNCGYIEKDPWLRDTEGDKYQSCVSVVYLAAVGEVTDKDGGRCPRAS